MECHRTCVLTEDCFAFDWNMETKTCWLHSTTSFAGLWCRRHHTFITSSSDAVSVQIYLAMDSKVQLLMDQIPVHFVQSSILTIPTILRLESGDEQNFLVYARRPKIFKILRYIEKVNVFFSSRQSYHWWRKATD